MESGSQDRNLPASERKLKKARDDGQVSRSEDLSHLAVLGAGAVLGAAAVGAAGAGAVVIAAGGAEGVGAGGGGGGKTTKLGKGMIFTPF